MRRICTYILLLCLGFSGNAQKVNAATVSDFIVPRNFTFSREMSLGSSVSPDVMYLQNILNMSTTTRVAQKGSGSNKSLTAYYGIKTKEAVQRFQKMFAVDIQYEKSLATSSASLSMQNINPSRVDEFTRAVLNKLVIIYTDDRDMYINSLTGLLPAGSAVMVRAETSSQTSTYTNKKTTFSYSPNGQIGKVIENNSESVKAVTTGSAVAGASVAAVRPLNFGGISTAMVTCTCSGNLLLYVQDVRGMNLPLIYQPGATVLYKMYRPTSGVNMLGQYVGGGVCLVYAGTSCVTGGTPIGTMIQLGTSLTIGPIPGK